MKRFRAEVGKVIEKYGKPSYVYEFRFGYKGGAEIPITTKLYDTDSKEEGFRSDDEQLHLTRVELDKLEEKYLIEK